MEDGDGAGSPAWPSVAAAAHILQVQPVTTATSTCQDPQAQPHPHGGGMHRPYKGNPFQRRPQQRGVQPVTCSPSASRRASRGASLRRGALCSSSSRRLGLEEVQASAQAGEVARLRTNIVYLQQPPPQQQHAWAFRARYRRPKERIGRQAHCAGSTAISGMYRRERQLRTRSRHVGPWCALHPWDRRSAQSSTRCARTSCTRRQAHGQKLWALQSGHMAVWQQPFSSHMHAHQRRRGLLPSGAGRAGWRRVGDA